MMEITNYESEFVNSCPRTYQLLKRGHLVIHPVVFRITLHGSRGPAGGWYPDSDIDLALHIWNNHLPSGTDFGDFLRQVLLTTLGSWKGKMELDLAAVFNRSACDMICFNQAEWDESICPSKGLNCLGIFKIQEGYDGFVTGPACQVGPMYPFLTIWRDKRQRRDRGHPRGQ